MKATFYIQEIISKCIYILISSCTNDLVINSKQVNYFEMFLISLFIESKNAIFPNNFYLRNFIKDTFLSFKKLNIKLSDYNLINKLNLKFINLE